MFVTKKVISITICALVLALAAESALSMPQRPRSSSHQPADQGWTIPGSTVISMRLDRSLTSRRSRVGDRFTATVTLPVSVNGRTVIPAGSVVEGRVTEVTPAKRMSRSGTIAIDFDVLILPDGSRYPLQGNLTSDDPETRKRIDDESRVSGKSAKRSGVFVGGGGAIGAVLGGIAGGGKGAILGGIVGAGAGVAGILLSKGEEAEVPAGAPFGIQLRQPLVLRENRVAQTPPRSNNPPARDANPDPDREPVREPVRETAREPNREPVREPAVDNRSEPVRPSTSARAEPAPASEALPLSSPEMIRRAQHALRDNGYYEGEIDGAMSPRTTRSLKTYQRENKLPETGELDQQTARSLGILGGSPDTAGRAREVSSRRPEKSAGAENNEAVLATVLSASANRTSDGAIYVLINTQAPTGGWRWFGDHVVNGDTLEVYARAIRPTGMTTQVLTRGRIEMNAKDGVQYVRRVVVHGAGGDINIPLAGRSAPAAAGSSSPPSGRSSSPPPRGSSSPTSTPTSTPSSTFTIQRQAEDLLSEYTRLVGVRLTGNGIEFEGGSENREADIELLFALDNFVNASQLYARLSGSLQDRGSQRGATLALAREARQADRVMTTTSSRAAAQLSRRWDAIRQDVLRLMQAHNITSEELEY